MTRSTNARVAGCACLAYVAAGIGTELLMHQARGTDSAATLVQIGQHAINVRLAILLALVECLSAFVLAVTLYGITREEDNELAMLALVCRVAEGMLGSISNIPGYLGLLWLALGGGQGRADTATTGALEAFLLMPGPSVPVGAVFFAVGNLIFAYLLLRGRIIPIAIAWLGVLASGLLVLLLPLQLAGFSTAPLAGYYQWLPALVFQIALALWLLIKGAAAPAAS